MDFGNLLIEANVHGRCNLRALEHSGFYVNDISQEQALSALEYWLPSQDSTPEFDTNFAKPLICIERASQPATTTGSFERRERVS